MDVAVSNGISQLSSLIEQGSEQLNTGFVRQFDSQVKLTGQMSTVLGSVEVLTAVLSDSVTQLSQMEEEVPTTVPQPSQPVASSPTLSNGHTRMGFAQSSNTPASPPWPGYLQLHKSPPIQLNPSDRHASQNKRPVRKTCRRENRYSCRFVVHFAKYYDSRSSASTILGQLSAAEFYMVIAHKQRRHLNS